MDTNIQKLGTIDNVKIFFDPLRHENSFLVLIKDEFKEGFINEQTEEIILESGFNVKWENVKGLMGGFSTLSTYEKIKNQINEQVK